MYTKKKKKKLFSIYMVEITAKKVTLVFETLALAIDLLAATNLMGALPLFPPHK